MKLQFVSFLVLLSALALTSAQDDRCNPRLEECPQVLYDLINETFIDDVLATREVIINWPTTEIKVLEFCTKLEAHRSCITSKVPPILPNCTEVTPHVAQVYVQRLLSMQKYYDTVCTTLELKQQFLERAKCYDTKVMRAGLADKGLRAFAMWLISNQDGCCAILYFNESFTHLVKQNCKAEVTENVSQLVKGVLGPFYHDLCGQNLTMTYSECHAKLSKEVQEQWDQISSDERSPDLIKATLPPPSVNLVP